MRGLAKLIALVLATLLACPLGGAVTPALAQGTAEAGIDYDEWAEVARRAETALDAGRASDQAFESLRMEIVDWRELFLRRQNLNSARIGTLTAQIEALGPVPDEGGSEPAEIAERRASLNSQLAEATAPATRAEEAFSRADGLAGEIGRLLRERQADTLLRLAPTPLNPLNWPLAAGNLIESMREVAAEARNAVGTEARRIALRRDLIPNLLAAVIGAVFAIFGWHAAISAVRVVAGRSSERTRHIACFVTSFGQIALPVLGFYLLARAVWSAVLPGLRGELLVEFLPLLGLCVFVALWLGHRLFIKDNVLPPSIDAPSCEAASAQRAVAFTGLFVGLSMVIVRFADHEGYSEATRAVIVFPLAALTGLGLMRLGRLLRLIGNSIEDASGRPTDSSRGFGVAGLAAVIAGIIGIVLASVGYMSAAIALLLPSAMSLGLFGVLLLVNDLVRNLYALSSGATHEDAQKALLPTLANFLIAFASIPLFALIWGASAADLAEIWTQFREGFQIGETRISPANFLTFAVVFAALYVATRMIQGSLRDSVLPKTGINIGGRVAIVSGIGYIGIFLAAVVAITAAGIDLSSLAIVAGALSVGIGFGLQNIVQNFVSGIILLIERPVTEGDWIEVGGHVGIVKKISVRSTVIETFDRTDVVVPNGDFISSSVTNWTRSNPIGRVTITVSVAYGTDTRKVESILKEIAQNHPLVTMSPEPGVDFVGFGADGLDFRIRAVISDVNFSLSVKTEINHEIAARFAAEGIEIPFAQRDIWLRNPDALRTVL